MKVTNNMSLNEMDSIDFEKLSPDEFASMILSLREKRNKAVAVPTLLNLAVESVQKHAKMFIHLPVNPFKTLTNLLAQVLIKSCQKPSNVAIYTPSQEELDTKIKLVSLVLENDTITHLDLLKLLDLGRKPCIDFFHLALQNCPKLVYLRSPSPFLYEDEYLDRLQVLKLVPRQWEKLTCLDLSGFTIFDDAMELLKNEMQRLRKLNVFIVRPKFSMTGARHLAEMKNLVELKVQFTKYGLEENRMIFCNMLVFVAGCLPKLEVLRINNNGDNNELGCDFAYLYGDVFPRKKLVCPEEFYVAEHICYPWPQCLHVNKIFLSPLATTKDTIKNLRKLPCPITDLKLSNLQAELVYPLLREFGAGLKELKFHEGITDFWKSRANLAKALSMCPNLEIFSYMPLVPDDEISAPLETFDLKKLPTEHFRNMVCFDLIGDCRWHNQHQLQPFVDLYKIALASAKDKYANILCAFKSAVLTGIKEVMESDPLALSHVEVLNLAIHSTTDGENFLRIGKMLMLRSPRFYRFEIHSWAEFKLPLWFQKMASSLNVIIYAPTEFKYGNVPYKNLIHLSEV